MTQVPPPTDPVEALGEAYEHLLETLLDELHVPDPHHRREPGEVDALIERAAARSAPLQALAEADRSAVRTAVRRDLQALTRYRRQGGTDVKGWLGEAADRLERGLLTLIERAADPALTEWLVWQAELERLPYHTGEVTGPGVLVCDQCGERLHFARPARIPPCPKCHGTTFHRPEAATA